MGEDLGIKHNHKNKDFYKRTKEWRMGSGYLLATQISLQANSVVPSSVCLKSLLFIDWIKVTRRVGPSRVGFESGAFVKRSQPERNTAWILEAAGLVL